MSSITGKLPQFVARDKPLRIQRGPGPNLGDSTLVVPFEHPSILLALARDGFCSSWLHHRMVSPSGGPHWPLVRLSVKLEFHLSALYSTTYPPFLYTPGPTLLPLGGGIHRCGKAPTKLALHVCAN